MAVVTLRRGARPSTLRSCLRGVKKGHWQQPPEYSVMLEALCNQLNVYSCSLHMVCDCVTCWLLPYMTYHATDIHIHTTNQLHRGIKSGMWGVTKLVTMSQCSAHCSCNLTLTDCGYSAKTKPCFALSWTQSLVKEAVCCVEANSCQKSICCQIYLTIWITQMMRQGKQCLSPCKTSSRFILQANNVQRIRQQLLQCWLMAPVYAPLWLPQRIMETPVLDPDPAQGVSCYCFFHPFLLGCMHPYGSCNTSTIKI